jgi:hypothetical protein
MATPNGSGSPSPLSGVELLALMAASEGPARRTEEPAVDSPPLDADAWTAPASPFLLRVDAGCCFVEALDGAIAPLDDIDVVLVDIIDQTTTAGAVFEAAASRRVTAGLSTAAISGRLRRLGALGCIGVDATSIAGPLPVDAQPVQAVAAPQPPMSLPRRLRRTRFPGRQQLAAMARRAHLRPAVPVVAPPVAAEQQDAPEPDEVAEPEQPRPAYGDPCVDGRRPGRVPVYAVFHDRYGPLLSLGMLTASARHHDGGALNERFEIRRPENPGSFLADLATREGPAILLCSNYVWSLEHNLDLARRAKAICPELLVIHGGPSTPKYEDDCLAFFATNRDVVGITIRGEGEVTLAHVLATLAANGTGLALGALADVEGITYRDPATGDVVSTPDRDRVKVLDDLPSPYLGGEFDHLPPEAWTNEITFETNRGCPYGCTFCDWGSSTLSRLRMFSLERVAAEMEWAGAKGLRAWVLGDANTGIMSRDVEVADLMVDVRHRHGVPTNLGFNVAKNTTKHLTAIVDRVVGAGIVPHLSLALQSTDETTLEAVHRTNINTDHYVALASSFRRRGLPLQADLMLGLPGQTLDSFTGDLQFLIDHEIPARIWITQLLPNAPMNHPDYRAEHQVQADEHGVVRSTSSFSADDRHQMMRIRHAYTVFERFGLLRQVSRFVQWDHGVPAMELLQRALDVSDRDPGRYPLLDWVLRYFDFFQVRPLGWRSFYAEVRRFLVEELGVPLTTALDDVLELQAFLMPVPGRAFPAVLGLRHDYVSYAADNTASLWRSGEAEPVKQPLRGYGAATVTVRADPMGYCQRMSMPGDDPRDETMTDGFWMAGHWELDSPLVAPYPDVIEELGYTGQLGRSPEGVLEMAEELDRQVTGVRVRLGRAPSEVA